MTLDYEALRKTAQNPNLWYQADAGTGSPHVAEHGIHSMFDYEGLDEVLIAQEARNRIAQLTGDWVDHLILKVCAEILTVEEQWELDSQIEAAERAAGWVLDP
jgi:hypothetical protein